MSAPESTSSFVKSFGKFCLRAAAAVIGLSLEITGIALSIAGIVPYAIGNAISKEIDDEENQENLLSWGLKLITNVGIGIYGKGEKLVHYATDPEPEKNEAPSVSSFRR